MTDINTVKNYKGVETLEMETQDGGRKISAVLKYAAYFAKSISKNIPLVDKTFSFIKVFFKTTREPSDIGGDVALRPNDLDINGRGEILSTTAPEFVSNFREPKIVEIEKGENYNVIVNLDRPEYIGIHVGTPPTSTNWFGNCDERELRRLTSKLIEIFYNISKDTKDFIVYGKTAMNLYNKSSDYIMDFRCLNSSRDTIKSMIEKFRDIVVETAFDTSEKMVTVQKTNIEEECDAIWLIVFFRHYFVDGHSLRYTNFSVSFKFDTRFYSNITQILVDRIDCNCIAWDGGRFYFNSRFERFMVLKSVIYDPTTCDPHKEIAVEQIRDCLNKGYAVLAPSLDYSKLKTSIEHKDEGAIPAKGIESILYKAFIRPSNY